MVADVGSYAATDKTTTDHALSAITKKDCSLFRLLSDEKKVCEENKKKEEKDQYTKDDIWTPDNMKRSEVIINYSVIDDLF